MHRILKEPLFHFVAIAALILLADSLWQHLRKPEVIVTAAAVEARSQEWQLQTGVVPNDEQRKEIARDLATEEVLFRESMKRDMATDNRVRTSLITMMRSALKPPVTPPSDEQLKEVRASSPKENIMLPPQISFEHVSYLDESEVPENLLERLRTRPQPPVSTSPVRLANPVRPTFRPQLERLLGTEFCATVFTLPLNEWQGPVESTRGIHFVRILDRETERPIPFEQIRGMLEAKWIERRENEAVAVEAGKLAEDYRIVLPDLKPTPQGKP